MKLLTLLITLLFPLGLAATFSGDQRFLYSPHYNDVMQGSLTSDWLHTSEVLKYFVFPNVSAHIEEQLISPVYLKKAILGPWFFCWEDPVTLYVCEKVHYDKDEDAADVTTGIQQSTRKAMPFMISGVIFDLVGLLSCLVCNLRVNSYRTLFVCTVLHILAGIANFTCIIVYMSAVSKEVGNKIFPAAEMDEPLFRYEYGYSFILLKISFLLTEVSALFSVVVYMAKRDERTFHRFKIRSILSSALSPTLDWKRSNGLNSPNGHLSTMISSTQSTLPPTPTSPENKSVDFF